MGTARVIEVVESAILRRGAGTEGDPIRIVVQYFSLNGELLAERDTAPPQNFATTAAASEMRAAFGPPRKP